MKKILVIEDDVDILDVVEKVLQAARYAVIKINREITLAEIRSINPNLIIVDFLLPYRMGNDICSEIKESPKTKHIPVILYSASNLLQQAAHECKADNFIAKPFDLDYLVSEVDRLAIA